MGYKRSLFVSLGHRGFFNWMSDKTYLKISYRLLMGNKLNLDNPVTFNEKLQWLKLYDRKKEYTSLVDKYEVYDYVKKRIGEEHLIPIIGVWERPELIEWEKLPKSFVLKCTHDSGGVILIKNKNDIKERQIVKKLKKKLKINYFYGDREWPYKNIKPRIIAQPYLSNENDADINDYKFFCFDGTPKYMFIAKDRQLGPKETKFNFYDMDFNKLDIKNGHDNFEDVLSVPKTWEEMKKIAAALSKGIPQVRVDLYEVNGKVFFGEMTFFHWSGMVPFIPKSWDKIFGDEIILPK